MALTAQFITNNDRGNIIRSLPLLLNQYTHIAIKQFKATANLKRIKKKKEKRKHCRRFPLKDPTCKLKRNYY